MGREKSSQPFGKAVTIYLAVREDHFIHIRHSGRIYGGYERTWANPYERRFGPRLRPYESGESVREYDPDHHLTKYAATTPCEDFAEMFHFYLRHKGRLPTCLDNKPAIVAKWKFVEWLACRISRRHHTPLKRS